MLETYNNSAAFVFVSSTLKFKLSITISSGADSKREYFLNVYLCFERMKDFFFFQLL